MDRFNIKGKNTKIEDALYLFDVGELTEKETYNMLQDITNKGLLERFASSLPKCRKFFY